MKPNRTYEILYEFPKCYGKSSVFITCPHVSNYMHTVAGLRPSHPNQLVGLYNECFYYFLNHFILLVFVWFCSFHVQCPVKCATCNEYMHALVWCATIIMHHKWFRALSSASDIHTQIKLLLSKDKWSNIMIFSSPRNENEGNNMRICDVHHGQFWTMVCGVHCTYTLYSESNYKRQWNLQ